jgi:hypothetical protein
LTMKRLIVLILVFVLLILVVQSWPWSDGAHGATKPQHVQNTCTLALGDPYVDGAWIKDNAAITCSHVAYHIHIWERLDMDRGVRSHQDHNDCYNTRFCPIRIGLTWDDNCHRWQGFAGGYADSYDGRNWVPEQVSNPVYWFC